MEGELPLVVAEQRQISIFPFCNFNFWNIITPLQRVEDLFKLINETTHIPCFHRVEFGHCSIQNPKYDVRRDATNLVMQCLDRRDGINVFNAR